MLGIYKKGFTAGLVLNDNSVSSEINGKMDSIQDPQQGHLLIDNGNGGVQDSQYTESDLTNLISDISSLTDKNFIIWAYQSFDPSDVNTSDKSILITLDQNATTPFIIDPNSVVANSFCIVQTANQNKPAYYSSLIILSNEVVVSSSSVSSNPDGYSAILNGIPTTPFTIWYKYICKNINIPNGYTDAPNFVNQQFVAALDQLYVTDQELANKLAGYTTKPTSSNFTEGDIVTFDANGNVTDSGKKFDDSTTTADNIWSAGQIQTAIDDSLLLRNAKNNVKVATTGSNITLSGLQTIDGITLSAGDKILVKDQTNQAENGLYIVASDAWTLSADFNSWPRVVNATCFIYSGTQNKNTHWACIADANGTIGTTAISFSLIINIKNDPYYLYADSNIGHDIDNNGTSAFPFRTINKAISIASFPNVLSISGDFTENLVLSSSSQSNTSIIGQGLIYKPSSTWTGNITTCAGFSNLNLKNITIDSSSNIAVTFATGDTGNHKFENINFITTNANLFSFPDNFTNTISLINCNFLNCQNSNITLPQLSLGNTATLTIYGAEGTINIIDNSTTSCWTVIVDAKSQINWIAKGFANVNQISSTQLNLTGIITTQDQLNTLLANGSGAGYYLITGFVPTTSGYFTGDIFYHSGANSNEILYPFSTNQITSAYLNGTGTYIKNNTDWQVDGTISLEGDVIATGTFGNITATVQSNVISNAKLAQAGANTYKGNATSAAADVSDIATNTAFNRNFETTTTNIKMDGTVSIGTLSTIPRADHVHPTDTTRAGLDEDNTFSGSNTFSGDNNSFTGNGNSFTNELTVSGLFNKAQTEFKAYSLANQIADYTISSAILNVYSVINLTQTTGGIAFTLASPTINTTNAKEIIITNNSSPSSPFTVAGVQLVNGYLQFIWNGSAWINNTVNFETTTSNIKMDGTASVGTLSTVPRADHVHPTDTTRASLSGNNSFTGTANTFSGSVSANNLIESITSVSTAGGTTTLTVSSAGTQQFTGTSTQTVVLPVVTTLALGFNFIILNRSTGNVTVNSSGGNLVQILQPNSQATITCTKITGTDASSWDSAYSIGGNQLINVINVSQGVSTIQSSLASNVLLRIAGVYTENITITDLTNLEIEGAANIIKSEDGLSLQSKISGTCTIDSSSAVSPVCKNIYFRNINITGAITINKFAGSSEFVFENCVFGSTFGINPLNSALLTNIKFKDCYFTGNLTLGSNLAGTLLFENCNFNSVSITNNATSSNITITFKNCLNIPSAIYNSGSNSILLIGDNTVQTTNGLFGYIDWNKGNSYRTNQIVNYQGNLYKANADISAGISFAIGSSGTTWSALISNSVNYSYTLKTTLVDIQDTVQRIVIFDTNAGNIPYNNTTGVWTLSANITYNITLGYRGGWSGWCIFSFYDYQTGNAITNSVCKNTGINSIDSSASISFTYTPSANQQICVKNLNTSYTQIREMFVCINQLGTTSTTAFTGAIQPTYSSSNSYTSGTLVTYNNMLYQAIQNVPTGVSYAPGNISYWSNILASYSNVPQYVEWTAFTPVIKASTTNPTVATPSWIKGRYKIVGKSMFMQFSYGHIVNTGSNGGNGVYYIELPAGYTINNTLAPIPTSANRYNDGIHLGSGIVQQDSAGGQISVQAYSNNAVQMIALLSNNSAPPTFNPTSNNFFNLAINNTNYQFYCEIPIN